mgnify:CR=1 FL=1
MGFDRFPPRTSYILLFFLRSGVELSVYTYIITETTYMKRLRDADGSYDTRIAQFT